MNAFSGEVREEIRRRLAALIEPVRVQRFIASDGCPSVAVGSSEDIADALLAAIEPYGPGYVAEGSDEVADEWIQFWASWHSAAQATQTGRVGVVLTLWLPAVDDAPDQEAE